MKINESPVQKAGGTWKITLMLTVTFLFTRTGRHPCFASVALYIIQRHSQHSQFCFGSQLTISKQTNNWYFVSIWSMFSLYSSSQKCTYTYCQGESGQVLYYNT